VVESHGFGWARGGPLGPRFPAVNRCHSFDAGQGSGQADARTCQDNDAI
jgi:hypothetical protein